MKDRFRVTGRLALIILAAFAVLGGIVSAVAVLSFAEEELLLNIGTGIYGIGVIAGAIFTVYYGSVAKWWQSAIGRMFISIGLAIVFSGVVVLLSLIFGPEYAGRLQVRIIGYSLYTFAIVNLLATFIIERRKPPEERELPVEVNELIRKAMLKRDADHDHSHESHHEHAE